MKRYLKNLWLALTGRNPYKKELEQVTLQRDDAKSDAIRRKDFLKKALASRDRFEQQVKDYQNLTENLRKHLVDKDIRIDAMSRDYSNAIDALRGQHRKEREEWQAREQELIECRDAAREQLEKASADIGREMANTSLLQKTNAALNDLCTAMESEDVEKMKHVVEYLDWSNVLPQIAQLHLNVLSLKIELEELTNKIRASGQR